MDREKLMEMPISQLRGLDIKTVEEERLVQEVLNEKLVYEPDPNPIMYSSSETDQIKTPEQERELQAKLERGEYGIEAEPSPEHEEPLPEVPPIPEPQQEPQLEVIQKIKPFCEFCDSKGVRHKKNCTRLQANLNQNV